MDGMEATKMTQKRSRGTQPPRESDERLLAARSLDGSSPAKRRPRGTSRKPSGRRTQKQLIGQAAENIAADFLRGQGLEILERNYLRRLGELDIVARDRDVLVIAEVRTRATDRYGGAAASVDARKQRRLIRAASQLLQQRNDLSHLRVRFDVVAVLGVDRETPHVDWIRHACLT
jgi:putative endonuclease